MNSLQQRQHHRGPYRVRLNNHAATATAALLRSDDVIGVVEPVPAAAAAAAAAAVTGGGGGWCCGCRCVTAAGAGAGGAGGGGVSGASRVREHGRPQAPLAVQLLREEMHEWMHE
jgi:hypothetical protein